MTPAPGIPHDFMKEMEMLKGRLAEVECVNESLKEEVATLKEQMSGTPFGTPGTPASMVYQK